MHTLEENSTFDEQTKNNISEWLSNGYDHETVNRIKHLLKSNPSELTDAFYKKLEFGTGGFRALMGVGCNRINKYTVQAATQGFANYILKQKLERPRIIIGFDTRNNSHAFALEVAKVLAANEIEVVIFNNPTPTPLVSFGCRFKSCSGAIVITASHNPPEYNGFKVYWKDGAQVLSPHDKAIIDEVNKITDLSMVKTLEQCDHTRITSIDGEIENAYLDMLVKLQYFSKINQSHGDHLKIVYTSLFGTGITIIPKALQLCHFKNLTLVDSQCTINGNFPNLKTPNPEDPAAMQLGMETLVANQGDILLATDPDGDRLGIGVNHQGKVTLLTGNQIACLCVDHICKALSQKSHLPKNAAFIKTVVTTELFKAIVEHYQAHCFDTLTGFKYIAEIIASWDISKEYRFIFGAEESHGYLLETYVRDKDAVSASVLMAEIALQAKINHKTLLDLLEDLYLKYGFYYEKVKCIKFAESKSGHDQMVSYMDNLRKHLPTHINNHPIEVREDYLNATQTNLITGKKTQIPLPKADLICFRLENKTKIMIRPSGTEPKIKIYCEITKKVQKEDLKTIQSTCEKECHALIETIEQYAQCIPNVFQKLDFGYAKATE